MKFEVDTRNPLLEYIFYISEAKDEYDLLATLKFENYALGMLNYNIEKNKTELIEKSSEYMSFDGEKNLLQIKFESLERMQYIMKQPK